MICPKCKTEYPEGFDTCTDCMVSLVPVEQKKAETDKNMQKLSPTYRRMQSLHFKNKNNLDLFFYIGFLIFFALLNTLDLIHKALSLPYILLIIMACYHIGKFAARLEVKAADKDTHVVDDK